jgi:hypothetical protein
MQRPPLLVRSTPSGSGQMRVAVDVTTTAAYPDNVLRTLRITALANATVEFGGRKIGAAGVTVSLYDDEINHLEFTVQREQRHQAFSASFAVSDLCGEWQSFAGGGPAVN